MLILFHKMIYTRRRHCRGFSPFLIFKKNLLVSSLQCSMDIEHIVSAGQNGTTLIIFQLFFYFLVFLWEAAFFFSTGPLRERGGGVRGRPLRKKNTFFRYFFTFSDLVNSGRLVAATHCHDTVAEQFVLGQLAPLAHVPDTEPGKTLRTCYVKNVLR